MRITQIIEHKKGVRAVKSTVKPRNFVAKNAIQSGAGAHKDKKKAAKQGDVKHKAQAVAEGIGDTISTVATKVGDTLASALPKEYRPFDNDTAAKNQQSMKVVKNEDSREYDDEVGMAENQLQTIQRCAREMEENLIDGENLPEWIQSKITIAKENLVTAFDYILSQHQNGEIAEASTNPDTMSATDYDRYQQGQMDSERRNFKRDEMEQELSHEDRGMYFVVIAKNGKWEHTKAQPRQEGMNAAQKVINALHAKYPSMHLGMQGPDGKVYNMGKGN
jgi:antitoxin component of RelBE/YafQ-DinJ toxin-antitoxin module